MTTVRKLLEEMNARDIVQQFAQAMLELTTSWANTQEHPIIIAKGEEWEATYANTAFPKILMIPMETENDFLRHKVVEASETAAEAIRSELEAATAPLRNLKLTREQLSVIYMREETAIVERFRAELDFPATFRALHGDAWLDAELSPECAKAFRFIIYGLQSDIRQAGWGQSPVHPETREVRNIFYVPPCQQAK